MIDLVKKHKQTIVGPIFPVLSSEISKKACALVKQNNCSNKILLGITQGIGNVIMATPLIKALKSMNLDIDILDGGFNSNAIEVLKAMPGVNIITEGDAEKRIYLLGIQTIWPRTGIERYCAQTRSAGNIISAWQMNIFAHEVEMNMAVAYTLDYKGEVPSLYCHYQSQGRLNQMGKHQIHVGIHICRSYNHQFYANRALRNPLQIAIEIEKAGYNPVIVGHKDCITEAQKKEYPISTIFMDGLELSQTAGVIRELDCMINEDSGIMHVTAAMDTPQVAVFGPTSDIKNRPWSSKAVVIKQGLHCVPCQYTQNQTQCTNNECMNISPETIVDQVKKLIEKFSK